MGQVIAVLSGKGGVGKTSICCFLGQAFARQGKKTALVELDCGLRGLDIMLGITDTVYDLDDVLTEKIAPSEAMVSPDGQPNLALLPAPATFEAFPSLQGMGGLCQSLLAEYDVVLLDIPAGGGMISLASLADLLLVVTTPDPVCVRDCARLREFLQERAPTSTMRLLINRVKKEAFLKGVIRDLDQVIDETGIQLIGVIYESREIYLHTAQGRLLAPESEEGRIFSAIARRVGGEQVALVGTRQK